MDEDLEAFIEEQKQKLAQEREVLGDNRPANAKSNGNRELTDPSSPQGLPLGGYEERRRKLQEERAREYNSMMAKKGGGLTNGSHEKGQPSNASPQNGLIDRLGQYEQKRNQLQKERAVEYNRMLAEQKSRGGGIRPQNNPHATSTSPATAVQKQPQISPERAGNNDLDKEFQEFLAAKQLQAKEKQSQPVERTRPQPQAQITDSEQFGASLPGVRDHPSAEIAKMRERNREYNEQLNHLAGHQPRRAGRARWQKPDSVSDEEADIREFLQEHRPRKGWATPTYEEILDKKRQDERRYRRFDDPELYGGPGLRSSFSDGHLNRHLEEDNRRFQELDREFESKKVRFRDEPNHSPPSRVHSHGILDDPDWLGARSGRNDRYDETDELLARLRLKYGPDYIDDVASGRTQAGKPNQGALSSRSQKSQRDEPDRRRNQFQPPSRTHGADPVHDQYQATLPIGSESRLSADQRRKEAYRQELVRQMDEVQAQKRRERSQAVDPPVTRMPAAAPVPLKSPTYDPRVPAVNGLPYSGLQDPLRLLLENDPSWSPLYNAYNPPIDRNQIQAPPLYSGYNVQEAPSPNRGFQPERMAAPNHVRNKSNEPKDSFPFPNGDDLKEKQRQQQKAYQEELKRQVEEQKLKKEKEKEDRERYERKLDEEIRNYDPFGRGGAGAPMRDGQGNILASRKPGAAPADQSPPAAPAPAPADLRTMHNDNQQVGLSNFSGTQQVPAPTQQTGDDPANFARGGHGIFGEPKTNQEKTAQQRYQDELRKQMEEKKRAQEEEKAREKEEESRLMKKIEEDNRRLQEELDEEKRKDREKAEEAQRQAEELRLKQEERRREENERRKAADEKHLEELRQQEEQKRLERQRQAAASPPLPAQQKQAPQHAQHPVTPSKPDEEPPGHVNSRPTNSPPIPSLRKKGEAAQDPVQNQSDKTNGRSSPPVPAQRTQSRQSRAQSADVLNQLAKMRQQLQSERRRVEIDLNNQQTRPEAQKPAAPVRQSTLDVFEVARNREPVSVRRDSANPQNLRDFQQLRNDKDSQSRQALRNMFPNSPSSSDALEAQQRVLLLRQEEEISKLKKRERGAAEQPSDLGLIRSASVLSSKLLDSDTAFIAVGQSGLSNVPEDEEDLSHRHRNPSARTRRRPSRTQTPQDPASLMGSVTSLDPDGITRRNEERLRKLKSLAGDDLSLGDPDDILERFMAKQKHVRPPSGRTLLDDSWLRPSSNGGK